MISTPIIIMTSALLLIAAVPWFIPKLRQRAGEFFANAITAINIHPKGRATFLADASFTSRYLLCKAGSDYVHIGIAGATDIPLGVVPDMTPTTDTDLSYWRPVNLLGLNEDTERMQASAAIAVGALLVPAAIGQVATAPGSGAGYVVGRALTASVAAGAPVRSRSAPPPPIAALPRL